MSTRVTMGVPQRLDLPFDIFVSYTRADLAWAQWMTATLEHAGFSTRFQERDFGFGNFVANIDRAVGNSAILLAVLSPEYLESRWTNDEWTTYFKRRREALMPVLVSDDGRLSLLDTLVRVNLVGIDEGTARSKLVEGVESRLGRPRSAARGGLPAAAFPGANTRASVGGRVRTEPVVEILPGSVATFALGDTAAATAALAALGLGNDLVGSWYQMPDDIDTHSLLAQVRSKLSDLGEVTDVVVAVSGLTVSEVRSDPRLRMPSTSSTRPATTSLSLVELGEELSLVDRRLWTLFDIRSPAGTPVEAPDEWPGPVLERRLGGETSLTSLINQRMTRPWRAFDDDLPDGLALTLSDLARLLGRDAEVRRPPPDERADEALSTVDSAPLAGVPALFASPLAWRVPEVAELSAWCAVVGGNGGADVVEQALVGLDDYRNQIGVLFAGHGLHPVGDRPPDRLTASRVLASPVSFADALARVCSAEVAFFDLTDYEPAVLLLLGARSVIRRGVTVCLRGPHRDGQPGFVPFLLPRYPCSGITYGQGNRRTNPGSDPAADGGSVALLRHPGIRPDPIDSGDAGGSSDPLIESSQ